MDDQIGADAELRDTFDRAFVPLEMPLRMVAFRVAYSASST